MTGTASHPLAHAQPAASLLVPAWVISLFAGAIEHRRAECDVQTIGGAWIASTTIAAAAGLSATQLRAAVGDAYARLFDAIGAAHVVRAWNFVPDILAPMSDGGDRYMSFNAGRHDAFTARFGAAGLASSAPAATGVGHAGGALSIHVLATAAAGRSIDNPRQTPAHRYSPRFGPLPPCFARATRVVLPAGPRLLVAGTAAIRGEATRFANDFDAQLRLTIDNLLAVLPRDECDRAPTLDRFESLRVYAPPMADLDAVERVLPRGVVEIEPVAALCRADLLIEIEGVAFAAVEEWEMR